MKKKDTVLVVEDDYINRTILSKIVATNYDVLEASNGLIALNIIKDNPGIAAIVVDLIMPVMDGYQLIEQIKKLGLTNLPILVVTGQDDESKEAEMLGNGVWDFVRKPYNAKILSVRLENIIQRSQVSLYKEMERALAHDPLTGLHNRSRFFIKSREMIDNN